MKMSQIMKFVNEVYRKMAAGEDITQEDIENLGEAASASGRLEHRALYSSAKEYAVAPREKKAEPEEPAKITEEDIKAAGEKAKRTSHIDDHVRYATLRTQYQIQQQQEEIASQN